MEKPSLLLVIFLSSIFFSKEALPETQLKTQIKTEQTGYVGSIPLVPLQSKRFAATGIGTSSEGELFVSGPRQIWGTTFYSDHFWARSISPSEDILKRTRKSYYDQKRSQLYVCTEAMDNTAGGILIIQREEDGNFKWLKSINFSDEKQSCGKVTVLGEKYLLAINTGKEISKEKPAIYYQDLSQDLASFPEKMTVLQNYEDVFGEKAGTYEITSIAPQAQIENTNPQEYQIYLITKDQTNNTSFLAKLTFQESKQQEKNILVKMGSTTSVELQTEGTSKKLNELLNFDNKNFLFSDGKRVYTEQCNDQSCTDPVALTQGIYENSIGAIAFGPDHFFKTDYPVFFVLPNTPQAGQYNINEYSFDPEQFEK